MEKVLTDEQKQEIVRKYIDGKVKPGAKRVTQAELAKEYGVGQQWISAIIRDSSTLERLMASTRADAMLSIVMAQRAAPDLMEKQIKDGLRDWDDNLAYNGQNARRDVMDRGGIRAAKEDKQDVTITFNAGGLDIGTPDHSKDDEE